MIDECETKGCDPNKVDVLKEMFPQIEHDCLLGLLNGNIQKVITICL